MKLVGVLLRDGLVRVKKIVPLLLLFALCISASVSADLFGLGEWTSSNGDLERSGSTNLMGPSDNDLQWSHVYAGGAGTDTYRPKDFLIAGGYAVQSIPVVHNFGMFVQYTDYNLTVVNVSTGEMVWTVAVSSEAEYCTNPFVTGDHNTEPVERRVGFFCFYNAGMMQFTRLYYYNLTDGTLNKTVNFNRNRVPYYYAHVYPNVVVNLVPEYSANIVAGQSNAGVSIAAILEDTDALSWFLDPTDNATRNIPNGEVAFSSLPNGKYIWGVNHTGGNQDTDPQDTLIAIASVGGGEVCTYDFSALGYAVSMSDPVVGNEPEVAGQPRIFIATAAKNLTREQQGPSSIHAFDDGCNPLWTTAVHVSDVAGQGTADEFRRIIADDKNQQLIVFNRSGSWPGPYDISVFALSYSTGEILWGYSVAEDVDIILSDPLLSKANDLIYMSYSENGNGHVIAFDANPYRRNLGTRLKWTYDFTPEAGSMPYSADTAIGYNMLFVGGSTYAFGNASDFHCADCITERVVATNISTSGWNQSANPGNATALGGYLSSLDLNSMFQTDYWAGLYGSFNGSIVLADSAENRMYRWTFQGDPTGLVIATLNDSLNVAALSLVAGDTYACDTAFFLGTGAHYDYNCTATFNESADLTLCDDTFEDVPIVYTYVNNASQGGATHYFGEWLMQYVNEEDPTNHTFLFIANVTKGTSYNGSANQYYQMLLPDYGPDDVSSVYYLYAVVGQYTQ